MNIGFTYAGGYGIRPNKRNYIRNCKFIDTFRIVPKFTMANIFVRLQQKGKCVKVIRGEFLKIMGYCSVPRLDIYLYEE